MKLVNKKGQFMGGIKEEQIDNRQEIFQEFLETMGRPKTENLQFVGTLEEVPDKVLNITLERGTWDILEAIVKMVIKYHPGDIVEIGMGESTEIFADIAYNNNVNLYSCDIEMGGMFKVFDKPLFENHHCFLDGSKMFMKEYDGFPSVVFIDGEHRYETTKKEVEFFLPRIRPGKVMFLHDTMPIFEKNIEPDSKGYNPGDVYKVRQELERMPEYDVFTWPYSAHNMGLTMVMVHGTERPYWRENGRATS